MCKCAFKCNLGDYVVGIIMFDVFFQKLLYIIFFNNLGDLRHCYTKLYYYWRFVMVDTKRKCTCLSVSKSKSHLILNIEGDARMYIIVSKHWGVYIKALKYT